MKKEEITLPPDFGKDETNRRIACIFNVDVKQFIVDLEEYNGSYIDKRFWHSKFWVELKGKYV